jgi:hypothetical protein
MPFLRRSEIRRLERQATQLNRAGLLSGSEEVRSTERPQGESTIYHRAGKQVLCGTQHFADASTETGRSNDCGGPQ